MSGASLYKYLCLSKIINFQNIPDHRTKVIAHLPLKPDAKPISRLRRLVPYAALELVDQELNRLQHTGLIQPVNYSAWTVPIVVIRQPNRTIRICQSVVLSAVGGMRAVITSPLPTPWKGSSTGTGKRNWVKVVLMT